MSKRSTSTGIQYSDEYMARLKQLINLFPDTEDFKQVALEIVKNPKASQIDRRIAQKFIDDYKKDIWEAAYLSPQEYKRRHTTERD